jgi:hypothetical protein
MGKIIPEVIFVDKTVKKDVRETVLKPIVPKTEPGDGAYIDTLKQLQEDREKAD